MLLLMLGGYVASTAKGAHVSTVILLPDAVVMLVAGLTASLLLENFVEPKVMGRTLATHPLIALVTTFGWPHRRHARPHAGGGPLRDARDAIARLHWEASSNRWPTMPKRPCGPCSADVDRSLSAPHIRTARPRRSAALPASTRSTIHHIYVMQAEAALRLNELSNDCTASSVAGRLAY